MRSSVRPNQRTESQKAGEPRGGLRGRVALAMGMRGEALQDVGDGNLARAAHHAIIALRAVPHRARGEHLLLHAGADHHEQLARAIVHFAADGAGAGAHAALHAERKAIRAFDVFVDPAGEAEIVFAGRRGDRCSGHGLHPLERVGANRVDRLHVRADQFGMRRRRRWRLRAW